MAERDQAYMGQESTKTTRGSQFCCGMILMIEIIDDDVTMTVEIVMVIEEITEVVEVVDKSIGIKTEVRPVLPVVSLT